VQAAELRGFGGLLRAWCRGEQSWGGGEASPLAGGSVGRAVFVQPFPAELSTSLPGALFWSV